MKFNKMDFQGKWLASFGRPQVKGSWIIYGLSGHGKTRFALRLAKYLTRFEKVLYNSMEEGASDSLAEALVQEGIGAVKSKFHILDNEPIAILRKRLRKQRSENIIFIDSLQYSGLNYRSYIKLKEEFSNKLFIFLSHANGKSPSGRTAVAVEYDANIKMLVNQFMVFPKSRYGGNEPFVIWHDRAEAI